MSKIKWGSFFGLLISLTFIILLIIRLDLFSNPPTPTTTVLNNDTHVSRETWMNIYQGRDKIGFIHRTFKNQENGFHTTEKVFMQIKTTGISQPLHISTSSDLNADMTLSSFTFDLTSSLFRFSARGQVVKNKLILHTGLPGAQEKSEIVLKDIPHLSGNIFDKAFRSGLEKEASGSFSIFDPSTLGNRTMKITRNADEIISIMGKHILTQKYCADFMGAKSCAWIDKTGEVLKETGILGLSMEKVSPKIARAGISNQQSIDFTEIASLPAGKIINTPEKLTQIKIKISGTRGLPLNLNGNRQIFRQDILTITKEQLTTLQSDKSAIPADISSFLKSSPLVQSDHPQIKAQAAKIILPGDIPKLKAQKIVNWVYTNVEKKPVLSVPNALEVLNNKVGDCNEHAVLTAALLRAAGIPAQIETGLVYLRGRFYYHAWNTAYVGKWVTLDSVFNQFPADVTHIRLVRGEGSEQLDLIGVMGKIKLEVINEK